MTAARSAAVTAAVMFSRRLRRLCALPYIASACALFFMVALTLLPTQPVRAHTTSEAYLTLGLLEGRAGEQAVAARLDVALRDLDEALTLDADGNGEITWSELRGARDAIAAYAGARLTLLADGRRCTSRPVGELQVVEHGSSNHAVLTLQFTCPLEAMRELAVDYRLFADINPRHRALLKLQAGAVTQSAVLDPTAAAPQRLALGDEAGANLWRTWLTYVGQGVWHIWIGVDHILFLVALLLPAVLWRERARWVPVGSFGAAFRDVLKIVTAFTVAHSITLTLATLGVVTLPSRLVESAIAASVVLAAANNVRPLIRGRRWLVAFFFGLIHGFGFAGALAELGLPQGALALSLFGFNLGVEVGQLAIVVIFLPLAYALRSTRFYRRMVLVGGSLAIAVLALWWFAERAFGFQLGWFG